MGWRYRRSIKLLPGIRMNVGSRGVSSFSFGGRGMTVNVSKRGTKTTYSLPGTGISYQTRTSNYRKPRIQPSSLSPTSSPSTGNVPMSSARRKAIRVYAAVGVAAVIVYFALKPGPLPPQTGHVVAQAQTTSTAPQPSPQLPGLSAVISPAAAAPMQSGGVLEGRIATTTTGANVRTQPSRLASIAAVLDRGTMVRVVGTEGVWDRVVDQDGKALGWIHQSILR